MVIVRPLIHLLLIPTLLLSSGVRAGTMVPNDETWIEVDTGHFRLTSNAEEEITRRVARNLEELRAVLVETTGLGLTAPVPIHIIVFRDGESFTPYKTRYQGIPAPIGGFYLRSPDAAYIVINAGMRIDATSLMFHEYVHAVLADHLPGIPLWLGEGLACFFESFTADGDTATIGLPVDRFWDRYQGSGLIPMGEFLDVDRHSPHYRETARSGLFYFQSWALAHYLVLGIDDHRLELDRFFRLLDTRSPTEDGYRRALETDAIVLEVDLEEYLRQPSLPHQTVSVSMAADPATTARTVAQPEVLSLLGSLLAAQNPPRSGDAADHFEAALGLDPECARAHAGMALLAETDDRLAEAREGLMMAMTLAPNDGWIHYRWGAFLFHRTTSRAEAIAALERSLELDPGFGPTWAVLATAYAERREPGTDVMRVARHAFRLFPSDPDVIRSLLILSLADDLRDEASGLIETAFVGNPDGRSDAVALVIRNDLRRTNDAILATDLDTAAQRFALAQAEFCQISHEPGLALEIDLVQSRLAVAKASAGVDEAQRLYNAGWTQPALGLLEEVLAAETHQDVADEASLLRWKILNPGKTPPQKPTGPIYPLTSRGEIESLNRYLAEGDFDAALAFLIDLDSRVSATDRSWIDAKIDEIQRAITHNRFAESYNRAVDAINDGHPERAEAIIVDLLGLLPEGRDADVAKALLVRIRRPASRSP